MGLNGVTHVYAPQTEERRLQMALSTLISDAKINAKERTRASQETVEKSKAQLITVRSKSSALSLHHITAMEFPVTYPSGRQ